MQVVIGNLGQKADQLVDKAKSVAIAGVIATFFGLAGVLVLAAAMASTLAMWVVWPAALAITAVAFLAITSIALWMATQAGAKSSRDTSRNENNHQTGADEGSIESALSAMTDLPMEVARKIISERPIAALAVFSGFGVLIARRPEVAIRLVERLIARFT